MALPITFPRFSKNFLSNKGAGKTGNRTHAITESTLAFFGLKSSLHLATFRSKISMIPFRSQICLSFFTMKPYEGCRPSNLTTKSLPSLFHPSSLSRSILVF
ncbi:hypothetical protein K1719_017231 [Acacia pycnantha]|nr:hypothetical protein K1719_017231 [Acacia pycnantha]